MFLIKYEFTKLINKCKKCYKRNAQYITNFKKSDFKAIQKSCLWVF